MKIAGLMNVVPNIGLPEPVEDLRTDMNGSACGGGGERVVKGLVARVLGADLVGICVTRIGLVAD